MTSKADRRYILHETRCAQAFAYGADGKLATVSNAEAVVTYAYDAFGRTITQSGPLADVFRHRFSTKPLDSGTGLYYYGYRFYVPSLMRWLNRDPIEESEVSGSTIAKTTLMHCEANTTN